MSLIGRGATEIDYRFPFFGINEYFYFTGGTLGALLIVGGRNRESENIRFLAFLSACLFFASLISIMSYSDGEEEKIVDEEELKKFKEQEKISAFFHNISFLFLILMALFAVAYSMSGMIIKSTATTTT